MSDQIVDQDYYIRFFVPHLATGGILELDWTNANNNECIGAKILGNGSDTYFGSDMSGSTLSSMAYPPCASPDTPQKDVWYKITPGLAKRITISMEADLPGSGFVVYSGSCGALTLVGCSAGDTETESLVFFSDTQTSRDYYIRLYGSYAVPPGGILEVDWTDTLAGQYCQVPQASVCGDQWVSDPFLFGYGQAIPGTSTDVAPCATATSLVGHWLSVTIPSHTSMTVTVTDYDLSWQTAIAFYTACGQSPILCAASPGSAGQPPTSLSYNNTTASAVSLLVLFNHNVSSVAWEAAVACESIVYGQTCAWSQTSTCGDIWVSDPSLFGYGQEIPGATTQTAPCATAPDLTGHWLAITVPAYSAMTVTVTDYDLNWQTAIAFYTSCGSSPVQCAASPGNENQPPTSLSYTNSTGSPVLILVLVNHHESSYAWEVDVTCP